MNRLKIPLVCVGQGIDTSTDNPAGRHKAGVEPCLLQVEEVWGKPRTNAVAPVKAE